MLRPVVVNAKYPKGKGSLRGSLKGSKRDL